MADINSSLPVRTQTDGDVNVDVNDISAGTQTNDVKITLDSEVVSVSNAGTFAVQEDGAALTALQLIDDAIFADDAAFTVGTSKVAATGYLADDTTSDSVNEGDVGIPRMTLTRKPYAVITDATSENNAGVDASGHLQVDIAADSVGVGGGTEYTEGNTDTTITGKAILWEDTGDTLATVSAASPLPTDTINLGGTAIATNSGVNGGGVQRVTIATDDTVATDLTAIKTAVELIDDAISGTEMQVDVVAALPTGANTIGDVTVSGDALTALQLIDNPVATISTTDVFRVAMFDDSDTQITSFGVTHTDDAAFTTASDDGVPMFAMYDDTTPSAATEDAAGVVRMSAARELYNVIRDAAGNERGANVDANNNLQVIAAANSGVDIGDVTVNNAETNPVPVYMTSGAASGSEVNDYDTTAAVAASASDNHDYTVANTTFLLKQITFAASGKMKVELQTGPVASLATKGVWFISTANPSFTIDFAQPIEVPSTSTGTVRLIRTNLESSAMDVYSTIIGSDI